MTLPQNESNLAYVAPEDDFKDRNTKKEHQETTCYLCKRAKPVFAGTDEITRLPKSSISKFVKVLQADSKKKERYIRQLKITQ